MNGHLTWIAPHFAGLFFDVFTIFLKISAKNFVDICRFVDIKAQNAEMQYFKVEKHFIPFVDICRYL